MQRARDTTRHNAAQKIPNVLKFIYVYLIFLNMANMVEKLNVLNQTCDSCDNIV